jgi:hypothetical protein
LGRLTPCASAAGPHGPAHTNLRFLSGVIGKALPERRLGPFRPVGCMRGLGVTAVARPYLVPASVTMGVGLTDSLHLDHDLPFGSAPLEIRKRLPRLIERKYLVNHGPNAPHLEKVSDLCELATVWIHEQE